MKKRALIYGNQKCFSKYLKYKFQQVLSFDVCKKFRSLNVELNVYSVIVFVIYTEEDLLDFLKVYGKGIPLVVCTFNKRILEILNEMEDVFLLDTSKIRSEILNQLNSYFQEAILNIQSSSNTVDYKNIMVSL
jgi:hypothetical protein